MIKRDFEIDKNVEKWETEKIENKRKYVMKIR